MPTYEKNTDKQVQRKKRNRSIIFILITNKKIEAKFVPKSTEIHLYFFLLDFNIQPVKIIQKSCL